MKRYPRKKPKEHKKIDIMVPLQYLSLGSKDDPCFGQYSAKAKECKRCGDSEVCAAVSTNKLLMEITEVEKTQEFKDNHEGTLVDNQNLEIAALMIKRCNKKPDEWLSIKNLIPKLTEKFNLTARDEDILFQRCTKAANDSSALKLNKDKTKYRIA